MAAQMKLTSWRRLHGYATLAESRLRPRAQPKRPESSSIRVGHHLPATAGPRTPLPLVALKNVEVDAAADAVR